MRPKPAPDVDAVAARSRTRPGRPPQGLNCASLLSPSGYVPYGKACVTIYPRSDNPVGCGTEMGGELMTAVKAAAACSARRIILTSRVPV